MCRAAVLRALLFKVGLLQILSLFATSPLLGVKAAARAATTQKALEVPLGVGCHLEFALLLAASVPGGMGWGGRPEPCPKRLQHKETSPTRGKTFQGSQSWCDRSLCLVSFPFPLSFPPSVGKSGLKLLSLPAAEWCGQGVSAWPGWWMCWWWERKERKILMRKGLKFDKAAAELREGFAWLKAKQEIQHLAHLEWWTVQIELLAPIKPVAICPQTRAFRQGLDVTMQHKLLF